MSISSCVIEQEHIYLQISYPKATMEATTLVFLVLAISSSFSLALGSQPYRGGWKLLKRSIGVSAMHMALLPNDRIVAFDRTDFGPSNITLPEEKCKSNSRADNCYAHSVEFDIATRNVRPLTIRTDTWCSSGALLPDGVLIQSGGTGRGERVVRYFEPCVDCDWVEYPNGILSPRWYASNQILPNGKIIVVGGTDQFSYEFIPKTSSSDHTLYQLPFLKETRHSEMIQNNLYPFLHLSTDGNLFIFANDRAILLDYVKNKVVRNYPVMPGGVSRNYPSTGSSVLLPLKLSVNNINPDAEVFICGGTPPDSFQQSNKGIFVPGSKTCGRLIINTANPKWKMEEMPTSRVMGDMILLPTGDVLIINGAERGTGGWGLGREPVLNPVLYQPDKSNTGRFEILAPTAIPRLYHSTAHLLPDGRVLVGGSNPNSNYDFYALYPTELSLEAFYPPYLTSSNSRPSINWVKPGVELGYKQRFSLGFEQKEKDELGNMYITMVAPSFTSHSFSMNQRVLVLAVDRVSQISAGNYAVDIDAPAAAALAPPGYYHLFVIHEGVPSRGKWVHIK